MDRIITAIRKIKQAGIYPECPIVNSPHNPEIIVNKRPVVLFASNNYLGMLYDPRVMNAAKKGLEKWGIGNGSARLLTGNLEIHLELERAIADFKNKESALTFVAGYMVNSGCIPAIVNVLDVSMINSLLHIKKKPDTIIFSDEFNHASAIVGINACCTQKEVYKHNNMKDLEERLNKYPKKTRKLIVTDGVFSMDGDIVKLPEMVSLAKEYNAMIYLDDAHATGILGEHGRGTEDYYNIEDSVDFMMGTFTKAFGGVGGYIAGKQELIDYLKISVKTFIFTAPIAPPVAAGLIEAIKIIKTETWRREKLLENADYLRNELKKAGFNTGLSQTQIIPLIIGSEKKATKATHLLLEKGFFAPVAQWPAVEKGKARLRFAVLATHTKEQIDCLIGALVQIKKELKF